MKKLIIASILSVVAILGACGEVVKEEVDVKDVGVKEEAVETVTEETTEEVTEEATPDVKQVIAEDEFLKIELISIEKIEDEVWGDSIQAKFDVTNKTSQTITVQAREVSADGRMVETDDVFVSMSDDVSAGKIGIATMSIGTYDTSIELPELTSSLELILHTFYSDSYDSLKDYPVLVNF